MNCKQGDLARIVLSKFSENNGALVQVVEESPNGRHPIFGFQWSCRCLTPMNSSWGVMAPGEEGAMPDAWLRPLRDSEDPDETITWAGKPNETPTQIIKEIA